MCDRRLASLFLVAILSSISNRSEAAEARGPEVAMSPVRVTYAPSARIARGPHDAVLSKAIRPCAAYPASGSGILRADGKNMALPKRVSYVHADFATLPREERSATGTPFAEVVIDARGRVTDIHILRSVAPAFDRLFVAEMGSSIFEPARLDKQPVPVCMAYTARPHFR